MKCSTKVPKRGQHREVPKRRCHTRRDALAYLNMGQGNSAWSVGLPVLLDAMNGARSNGGRSDAAACRPNPLMADLPMSPRWRMPIGRKDKAQARGKAPTRCDTTMMPTSHRRSRDRPLAPRGGPSASACFTQAAAPQTMRLRPAGGRGRCGRPCRRARQR